MHIGRGVPLPEFGVIFVDTVFSGRLLPVDNPLRCDRILPERSIQEWESAVRRFRIENMCFAGYAAALPAHTGSNLHPHASPESS